MTDTTGIIDGLPEAEYHAHPSLSRSGAKTLLGNAARFHYETTHPRPSKSAFDVGTAAHAIVLGVGLDELDVIDDVEWRKKATKDARDASYAAGRTPLLKHQFEETLDMAEAVLKHPKARSLFEREGDAEQTVFWTDQADDGTPVECRARFDWLTTDDEQQPALVDLKTSGKDAAALSFARSVVDFGYDLQDIWYRRGFRFATGQDAATFTFVVVEKEKPHFVAVYALDHLFRTRGEELRVAALNRYAECAAADHWPAHSDDIQILTPPRWAA